MTVNITRDDVRTALADARRRGTGFLADGLIDVATFTAGITHTFGGNRFAYRVQFGPVSYELGSEFEQAVEWGYRRVCRALGRPYQSRFHLSN